MMHGVREQRQYEITSVDRYITNDDGSVKIPLTRGLFATVDASDAEWLCQWRWVTLAGRRGRFYAMRFQKSPTGFSQTAVLMHREILQPPADYHTDHIDNDGLNNRRSNLRAVTRCQNAQNARAKSRNSTGFKGVSFDGRKYVAQICANRQPRKLGRFDTPEEAFEAYCAAARELHGDFARLA